MYVLVIVLINFVNMIVPLSSCLFSTFILDFHWGPSSVQSSFIKMSKQSKTAGWPGWRVGVDNFCKEYFCLGNISCCLRIISMINGWSLKLEQISSGNEIVDKAKYWSKTRPWSHPSNFIRIFFLSLKTPCQWWFRSLGIKTDYAHHTIIIKKNVIQEKVSERVCSVLFPLALIK